MKKNYLKNINKKLYSLYGKKKGERLFDFYCKIMNEQENLINIKEKMYKNEYYNNIKDLKKAQINCFEKIDTGYYINDYIINFNNSKYIEWKEIY